MDFERCYNTGDIVEIVTPEDYRERGGSCTKDCALARFHGSVCKVIFSHFSHCVNLSVITLAEDQSFEYHGKPIESFVWDPMTLKPHEQPVDPGLGLAFDAVFQ